MTTDETRMKDEERFVLVDAEGKRFGAIYNDMDGADRQYEMFSAVCDSGPLRIARVRITEIPDPDSGATT